MKLTKGVTLGNLWAICLKVVDLTDEGQMDEELPEEVSMTR